MYKQSGIYCYQNLVNGKKYIGQSSDLKYRKWCFENPNKKYAGGLINRARKKYGAENFRYTILTHCSQKELNYWEKFYINRLKTNDRRYGYNLTDGGNCGGRLSEETIKKFKENGVWKHESLMKKVYVYTLDGKIYKTFKSVKEVAKYFNYDAASISNICTSTKGKTFLKKYTCSYTELTPNEVRIKIHSNIEKPVVQLDFEGNLIKRWECACKAAKELNIKSLGNISNSCKKKTATCNGYKWMFETDYNENGPIIINSLDKNGRIIQQIDKEGNIIKIFQSIAEVGRNGFSTCSVRACCIGKQKEHKGFIWKYMN